MRGLSRRHLATRLGAAAAHFGALLHHVVVSELLAILRARVAYLGAGRADQAVVPDLPEHQVRARLADFGAIGKQLHVLRVGVGTALYEAVVKRLQTLGL